MFQVLGQNLVNMEQKEQAKELMIPLGNTSTSTWYSHHHHHHNHNIYHHHTIIKDIKVYIT